MKDQNKTASQLYKSAYRELVDLMNQHYQISQVAPFHSGLPALAARIRKAAALCEIWKIIARYNTTQRFFKGG